MKQMVNWSTRSWFGHRKISRSGRFSFFSRRGGILFTGLSEVVREVYPMCGGDGLILLLGGRDRRQLVLLLMLSVEPSL